MRTVEWSSSSLFGRTTTAWACRCAPLPASTEFTAAGLNFPPPTGHRSTSDGWREDG